MKKLLNSKVIQQMFSYFFVGLGATIVEWLIFYLLNTKIAMHYAPSTALAFVISTFANWVLGRLLTFKESQISIIKELLSIYMASVVGLLFNLILMFLFVEKIVMSEMIAKMLATCIVFFWNFFIRKLVIYRKKQED